MTSGGSVRLAIQESKYLSGYQGGGKPITTGETYHDGGKPITTGGKPITTGGT